MKYTETKHIDIKEAAHWQAALDDNRVYPGHAEDAVLACYTVDFGEGIQADIKVCNGDSGPWIDAILFDQGHEVQVLEPSTVLLGSYKFQYNDKEYDAELVNKVQE